VESRTPGCGHRNAYKHWSRQQAIDYFLAHVAATDYSATARLTVTFPWPGQALAYKIGELKIRELRQRAEKELGPQFEVASSTMPSCSDAPCRLQY